MELSKELKEKVQNAKNAEEAKNGPRWRWSKARFSIFGL